MTRTPNFLKAQRRFSHLLILVTSILTVFLFTACGGTKVYNNDKTVVYNGAVYNVSKAKQITAKNTGKLSDTKTVSLIGADRKQIEAYLKENDSIYVRMAFDLDGQEMLYRASKVDSWSQYQKMQKSFETAGKQITSLLGDKKKMQLKLK